VRRAPAALLVVWISAAALLASCGGSPPSSSAAAISPSTIPTEAATASPIVTAAEGRLNIDALRPTSLDPGALTAVCDAEPAQANPDAGETKIGCYDGIVLGLRAIQTATDETILRAYLHRPVCAAIPCTADELNVATVTGWGADGAVTTTTLDARLDTVAVPTHDAAKWPPAGPPVSPRAEVLVVAGAPHELNEREPYPFCGRVDTGFPPISLGCFRTLVLLGRPAEVVEVVHGAEGGTFTWLFRYDGNGAITKYSNDVGGWHRQVGSMILGVAATGWDFDPWSAGAAFP
jgi:hypothetical protein